MDHHGGCTLRDIEEGIQGVDVGQVAQHHLHLFGDELDGLVIGENQGPDFTALFKQLHADVGAQKTGSTGQQIITIFFHMLRTLLL